MQYTAKRGEKGIFCALPDAQCGTKISDNFGMFGPKTPPQKIPSFDPPNITPPSPGNFFGEEIIQGGEGMHGGLTLSKC